MTTTATPPSKTTEILTKAATEFAAAKAGQLVTNLGQRAAGTAPPKDKTTEQDQDQEEDSQGFIGGAVEKLAEGASPIKAVMGGIGSSIKGLFKGKGGSKRPTNIVEDCYVGVPVDIAFAAWTQYEQFASFMKGVENVTRGDSEEDEEPGEGEETQWTAKVFINRRSWKATTTDYDPPNRISWKTEGAKGTVDGTLTFTAVGDNATLMLLVLEYRPKGLIEWVGNRWRAVGRRARLDLKHFRRYVMRTEPDKLEELSGQDTESEEPEDSEQEMPAGPDYPQEEAHEEPTDEAEDETDEEEAEEPVPTSTRRPRPARKARV